MDALIAVGALSVLFLLPFCVSCFVATKLFSSTNIGGDKTRRLFRVSTFIVLFYIAQGLVAFAAVAAFGPLGSLTAFLIGQEFVNYHIDVPNIMLGLYVLGVVVVWKRAGVAPIHQELPNTVETTRAVWARMLSWLMVVGAVTVCVLQLFACQSRLERLFAHSGAPGMFRHPSWCVMGAAPFADDAFVVDCIQKAVPEGKTLGDYCEYVPTSEAITPNQASCLMKTQLSTRDPAACTAFSKDWRAGRFGEADCLRNYVGAPEQVSYCTSAIQRGDFTSFWEAKCAVTDDNARAVNSDGQTLLFYAGTVEQQNSLFAHNADPNVRDIHGETPLTNILLGEIGSVDTDETYQAVVHLLEYGANPNVSDHEGLTPLVIEVVEHGTLDITKTLVQHGADVHFKNSKNTTVCSILSQGAYESPRQQYLLSLCK